MDQFVAEKLEEWGLTSCLGEIFEVNRIDEEAFKLLTKEQIKDLIVPVGDRSKFEHKFYNYLNELNQSSDVNLVQLEDSLTVSTTIDTSNKNSNGEELNLITITPGSSTSNGCQTSAVPVSLFFEQNVVEVILNSSLRGREVLTRYKKNRALDYQNLSSALIDHALEPDPDTRIQSQTFQTWANCCSALFPTESTDIFYNKSKQGTGGILYDKYLNKRRILKQIGMIRSKSTTADLSLDGEDQEAIDTMIAFLKNNMEPFRELEPKWQKTVTARAEAGKTMSIQEYFQTFKGLKRPQGYLLIDIDFKYLHENKSNKLFDIWPEVSTKLISVARTRIKDSDVIEFLKKYDETIKGGNNEVIQIIALLLLPILLKTASFKAKNSGEHWRPSLNEVQRGFVLHALTDADLQLLLLERQQTIQKRKLTNQPLPVIIGSLDNIISSKVKINETEYEMPSVLKAVDICYKSFFVLNAEYPVESKHIWTFLQRQVYDMTDAHTKKYMSVNKLITAVNKV